jgi:hypothetical protein
MKLLFTVALLLISIGAWAQDDLGPQAPVVKMAPAPVVTAVQGKPATVPLMFRVIPTALKVEATTDIVIGKTTYPEGQDMSFPFDPDEKLNVYTGDFKIDVLVRPLHSVQPGKYIVRATLKYQACDNGACYPPKQLPISFDVKIAKAPPAPTKNPAQSPHAHQ